MISTATDAMARGMIYTKDWCRDLYVDDVQDFIEFARHSGGFVVRDETYGITSAGKIVNAFTGLVVSKFGLLRDPKGRVVG